MSDNRIKIKSVQIKNFRSIRSETLNVCDFNIFVGLNDSGKSNFLKALNLFFNKQTDYNTIFDFDKDFSYLFPEKSHSTKEIRILIKFVIPETYKESGEYTWEQVWRRDDYHTENILNSEGQAPSSRSRVPSSLRRIKFRYVPAVKSSDYYRTLLGDLYSTVSSSLNNPLQSSTEAFSTVIKEYTKKISDDVNERLNMESMLTIPNNLSEIFRSLIFLTKSENSNFSVPLSGRGDGIQARHIPIILKYIADEDRKSRNQGSMQVSTIWGYEEPENGVEISKAFEMSDEFVDYARDIQIFASTHSPAFYMKKSNVNTEVFFVSKKPDALGTIFSIGKGGISIGESMGLMPLIAPFIAAQEESFRKAQRIYYNNALVDLPTIMVEGKTDKGYLEFVFEALSPSLSQMIKNEKLRIVTKDEGCGTTQLCDWTLAWIYSGNRNRLVILFDKDDAGIKAKNFIDNCEAYRNKKASSQIHLTFFEPSDSIISLYRLNVNLPYQIEHLLSCSMWAQMKSKNWVELRTLEEQQKAFVTHTSRAKSLDSTIDDVVNDPVIRDTIVTYNPNSDVGKKTKILDYVKKVYQEKPDKSLLVGFERTIQRLEHIFLPDQMRIAQLDEKS